MLCTLPLHKRCSCTVDIKIWKMRWMLRWRNTSNFSSCDFRSDQDSAPHKSRFIGIARKMRYLLYMSRWRLHHSSFRAPIEAFAAEILAVMSSSSRRLYDIREPRYLNVRIKLTKPSASEKFFVSSSQLYMSCSRSVCPGSCSSSSSEELIMRRPSGWYAATDFGSMRMMTVGCSLGVNMTYFLVCLQTVPALPLCAGCDKVTVMRHPMWKSVGHVELCVGCSIICVVFLFARWKALWIVVTAVVRCWECWKNWGGRKEDAFSIDVPHPMCISIPNLLKWW